MSPYALQKMYAEELCGFYTEWYDLDTICLRYFNVYGENQPTAGNYPQAIPIFLDRFHRGLPFTIYGTGEQRRDFTYVGDVVRANILAMDCDTVGIFNIGSGENTSINELCDMIDPIRTRIYKEPRPEPDVTLANINKANSILKWKPTVALKAWIESQTK